MNNVTLQEFPEPLVQEIKQQKNISKILYLCKSSSEHLYAISYNKEEKEIFKLVCYGEKKITKFLKEISDIPAEKLTYHQKNSLKKLNLLTREILENYNLESILLDDIKISKVNIDNYFAIYI